MAWLRPKTLKQQLILVNVITTGAALLLALSIIFSVELRIGKAALVNDLSIKADIIGNQCTAALTFNAPKDAEEILGALRADRQVEYASVYGRKGGLFAIYAKTTSINVPRVAPENGHRFSVEYLDLTRPILLRNEVVGSITIRANLEQLQSLFLKYAMGAGLVLLVSLTVASILLTGLQRSVTAPVTGLVRLMERVSREKDYSSRAQGGGPEELVSLASSFNEMLAGIQRRDRDLERSLRELKEAYGRLEDLDRLKSDFISTVSHELRTPITSIKAFVELLLIKPDLTAERKTRLLETINSESQRLSRLVNDLLDLSRIESGVMQWRDEDLDIKDVVEAALSGIAPLAQSKSIQVRSRSGDHLRRVRVDRDRLMQVLMNLLSNAIKFTGEGGQISVQVLGQGDPAGVLVSVDDTGVGIPAEDLGLIFERFHRSGDVLTSKVEGTGLGLAICRQIVEHYGGRIWAESEVGKGSRFLFFLPCAEEQGAEMRERTQDLSAR